MSMPQHKNPNKERKAAAPYNFVSLPEDLVAEMERPARDTYHTDRFTGAIHCTLKTETPLYTRAALEQGELGQREARNKADFFYIDPATKQPVIPGSSLRGMLRTLVEVVTFSKPQPVTDRQLFFRTLDDTAIGKAYGRRMVGGERGGEGSYPKVKAGYMERVDHGYRIRPAQTLQGTQFFRVEEDIAVISIPGLQRMARQNQNGNWRSNNHQWARHQVWFRPVAPTFHEQSAQLYADVTDIHVDNQPTGPGWVQGWFIASGWVPSKGKGKHRHWIIAPPVTDPKQFVAVNDSDIDAYEELGAGRSQTIEKQKMRVLSKSAGELIPCFYADWKDSQGNNRIAFGHTAMFRLPYEYSPKDLLPYTEKQLQITDFAEAIFGWVDDKKGRTIAGRVSVCDAHVTKNFTGRVYLLNEREPSLTPLLSGPKPTSFQHYLTQRSDKKQELFHYQDKGDTTLRGHKLYWHKDDKLRRQDYHDANATADSTQHTVMRPVDKGVTFTFDIHFENLAAEELGTLLWVLQVASDGKHCLKVGMAKPLGLGSVSVQSRLCLSGRDTRYRTLFGNSNWEESPILFESSQLADRSTPVQLERLNVLLQTHETVEVVDLAPFVTTFEQYILTQMKVNSGTVFSKLPRVQMLLALLQWPGERRTDGGYEQTRYMELDEFRQRPVLPDPVWVTQPALQSVSNIETNIRTAPVVPLDEERVSNVSSSDVLAYMDRERTKHVPDLQEQRDTTLVQPKSLDELKENDPLTGTVVRVAQDSVLVDVGSGTAWLHKDQTHPRINNPSVLAQNFSEGRIIQVWVKGRNKQGKVQLTMIAP